MQSETKTPLDISNLTWTELIGIVKKHYEKCPKRPIWRRLEKDPINKRAIDFMINRGLIVIENNPNLLGSSYYPERDIINLKEDSPYERDKTLFHEVMHAWYGEEIDDGVHCFKTKKFGNENRAIAEWSARRLRSKPELLRHTLNSFGLELFVYDKPSYEARYGNQLLIPIMGEHYKELKRITLMD